jgi:hypothetical protein
MAQTKQVTYIGDTTENHYTFKELTPDEIFWETENPSNEISEQAVIYLEKELKKANEKLTSQRNKLNFANQKLNVLLDAISHTDLELYKNLIKEVLEEIN